uniref:Claudin n=1 Tax=Scleropages formosus TaxID=113540 RepID=A0A8C9VNK5_SCLFO
MNPAVEVACFALGFLGWILVGVALPNRYWRVSTVDGNVITTSTVYENLWMSCAMDATGVHSCREFPSLLALSGYLQASRALMITAIVLGACGVLATLVGMRCSKAGGENYVLKGRIAGVGGVLFVLQGLCTMISVSWYGERTYFPLNNAKRCHCGDVTQRAESAQSCSSFFCQVAPQIQCLKAKEMFSHTLESALVTSVKKEQSGLYWHQTVRG